MQREQVSLDEPLLHQLDIINSNGNAALCHHSSSAVSTGGILLLGQQGVINLKYRSQESC